MNNDEEILLEKNPNWLKASPMKTFVGVLLIPAIVGLGFLAYLYYFYNKLIKLQFTSKKVKMIHRPHIVDKKIMEVDLDKIQGVRNDSTILQGLLNISTLTISSAATAGEEIAIPGMTDEDVKEIKEFINENQKNESEEGGNDVSIADELEKFNNLKEKGIITEEEFMEKKEKILS